MSRFYATALACCLSFLAGAGVMLAQQQLPGATRREPQFENEHMRVWKSIIMPKQPLSLHRHDHGRALIALTDGRLQVVDKDGRTLKTYNWERGKAYWLDADPPGEMHADVNNTNRPIEVIVVELKKDLPPQGTPATDQELVRRAVLDYVEGFYQGDTTRLVRSVAPTVYKFGYSKRGEEYVGSQMPFGAFMSYANGVKEGRNRTPANAPKEITLFDVQDQTASAKLTAWWGTDYLLLAKLNGRWTITHVLWQTPPPTR